MGSPFTITSVSNYNSNPPSDDGGQTAANRVQWSTQKQKLTDPLKTAFDASETATSTAFGKVVGGAGITTTAVDYTVTASDQGKLVKCTVAAKTITTPDATVVGSPFVFFVLNASSGDITLDGNGAQTVDGSANFTIPAGCGLMLNTDGSNWFSSGQNFNNVLQKPQGYLTLQSGIPVMAADVVAATSVFYALDQGDRIPISTDGSTFKVRQFSELALALVSNHLASTIYDVFVFDNAGTLTIGTGPAWNNSAAGAGSRGAGAGTTELQRVHGIFTNKNSMTARNGATTYTVGANQGTYVGSIFIDGSAGQVTCHRSYGQSRKWGVWNAYNRKTIFLKAGDATVSWSYITNTTRAANNSSANSLTVFSGLSEELYDLQFSTNVQGNTNSAESAGGQVGIGYNSTSSFSGQARQVLYTNAVGAGSASVVLVPSGNYMAPPSAGINIGTALENGNGNNSATWKGTEALMLLSARWNG